MDVPGSSLAGDAPITNSAERLLAALYTACSHDLPNQVLSLQSLIHLISMEESPRLDAEGRQYLERLNSVAERIAGISDFQKAIVRLARTTPSPRAINLGEMFRELQALARKVIKAPLAWELELTSPPVWADHSLVFPSIGDLIKAMVVPAGPTAVSVRAASTAAGPWVRLELTVRGVRVNPTVFERRDDVVLAKERLHAAGVGLVVAPASVDEARMMMEFSPAGREQNQS
jgi:light-regulated signal transduction histidine kinase (bacteriophytochrome)